MASNHDLPGDSTKKKFGDLNLAKTHKDFWASGPNTRPMETMKNDVWDPRYLEKTPGKAKNPTLDLGKSPILAKIVGPKEDFSWDLWAIEESFRRFHGKKRENTLEVPKTWKIMGK